MITDLSVIVGSEVLTAGVILWDIKPCSLLKVNRRFGGTYRLHIQGQIISGTRYQSESKRQTRSRILLGLFFELEDSSETSVDFQRTTRPYIPEDSPLLICK
jgi:hypothetical protein